MKAAIAMKGARTGGRDYRWYWNEEAFEKDKPYAVQSVEDPRLIRWLREETNLERAFCDGVSFLFDGLRWRGGRVLDVGAGVCWTSALLSKRPEVVAVRAIDYSRHRLERYAPMVIQQFGGNTPKIERVVTDVFDMSRDEHFDLIIFCQALYMFPDPAHVLACCKQWLPAGGVVMVTCERIIPEQSPLSLAYWKERLHLAFRGDVDASGRRRMVDSDYRRALEGVGLQYRFQALGYSTFAAANGWPAGNHFGIKA